jgi:Arc/MetJ family transcription regulator
MKLKTSITLSSDLLKEIDRNAGSKTSRSAYIEAVMREYLKEKVRRAINERDLQILNANADYFNREMEDVLRYHAPRPALSRTPAAGRPERIPDVCDCKPPIRNRFAIFNCDLRAGIHERIRRLDAS